ncbi:HxcX atypical pseudopilin [Halopseudomonas bauzanensis]|nr:HxcX atypical pseudopilin [Halopseudomonas bauzanensis]
MPTYNDCIRQERGMAVISVLLVVAVIAVLASTLLGRQTLAIRSAQTEQTRAEASWLLRGEVSRAQLLLQAEAQREPATRLDGLWNQPVNGQVISGMEGTYLFSELTDEQGKFNLRNLVDNGQVDPVESAAFQRLCTLLGIPSDQASLVARRVVLSLVEADRRSPSDSGQLQEREETVRAAQHIGLASLPVTDQGPRLRVVEDLLGVPGINADTVTLLRPYTTILPQRTWINSNTAKAEVLAAWVPGLSLDRARALLQARDSGQWFINRGDFANRLQIPDLDESRVLIGITSQWFRLSSALKTPRTTLVMQALVHDSKESLPQVVWLREGV